MGFHVVTVLFSRHYVGPELRFGPEPDRTGPYFRVRVRWLTRTGPTVPFGVQQKWDFAEPLRTRSNPFEPEIY